MQRLDNGLWRRSVETQRLAFERMVETKLREKEVVERVRQASGGWFD